MPRSVAARGTVPVPFPVRGDGASARWADWGRPFLHSPDLVLVLDGEARILFSNHPVVREPLENAAPRLSILQGESSYDLVRAAVLRVFDGAASERFEMGESGPAGSTIWYQCTASPVREGDATVAALVVCVDTTPRKRLEERLRRSEALLVDTQGTAHLGTWEWDVRDPLATWSEELYRIYGLAPQTYEPSYEAYLTKVHPEDRQRVMDATNRVFHEHVPYSHDERIFRPDGSVRYLHTWAHPILDENGKLVKLVGVCQDITDRKLAELALARSEERWRNVFQHAALGIARSDVHGHILEANPAFLAMLDIDADQAKGLTLDGLVHWLDAPMILEPLSLAMRGVVPSAQAEGRLARADGEWIWARITASRVPGTAEESPFAVLLVEDVTPRKQVEEAGVRIRELEETSARKSELLHIASHELKNPLTPINIQLHMLREGMLGELTPRQRKAVESVARESGRLGALVRDLLDAGRVQAGRLSIAPVPTDLAPVLGDVVETYRAAALSSGVVFELFAPDGLRAMADAPKLRQVLDNLVQNALRFTPAGGRVELRASATAGGKVRIEVSDTGPGLSEEQRGRLFQPFSQVHEGAKTDGGSGLGLYISRGIVEAHGGRIDVESELGHGATFFIELPAA